MDANPAADDSNQPAADIIGDDKIVRGIAVIVTSEGWDYQLIGDTNLYEAHTLLRLAAKEIFYDLNQTEE